jgi:hypothetical protein
LYRSRRANLRAALAERPSGQTGQTVVTPVAVIVAVAIAVSVALPVEERDKE